MAVALRMPGRQQRQPALFGTAGAGTTHEDFLALVVLIAFLLLFRDRPVVAAAPSTR